MTKYNVQVEIEAKSLKEAVSMVEKLELEKFEVVSAYEMDEPDN